MFRRLVNMFAKWANELLAPAEDPRQTFAHSYERQRELLIKVQEALGHVREAKARLERKTSDVNAKLPALLEQAQAALRQNDEPAARSALESRALAVLELKALNAQLREIQAEEKQLSIVENRISSQIEAFFARQELIAARYSAAEAQVRIQEALTGLSDELLDLSKALQRTEQKTERMQARAFAIDRLVEEGSLSSVGSRLLEFSGESFMGDDVSADVDNQLALLKEEIDPPADQPPD